MSATGYAYGFGLKLFLDRQNFVKILWMSWFAYLSTSFSPWLQKVASSGFMSSLIGDLSKVTHIVSGSILHARYHGLYNFYSSYT